MNQPYNIPAVLWYYKAEVTTLRGQVLMSAQIPRRCEKISPVFSRQGCNYLPVVANSRNQATSQRNRSRADRTADLAAGPGGRPHGRPQHGRPTGRDHRPSVRPNPNPHAPLPPSPSSSSSGQADSLRRARLTRASPPSVHRSNSPTGDQATDVEPKRYALPRCTHPTPSDTHTAALTNG